MKCFLGILTKRRRQNRNNKAFERASDCSLSRIIAKAPCQTSAITSLRVLKNFLKQNPDICECSVMLESLERNGQCRLKIKICFIPITVEACICQYEVGTSTITPCCCVF